MTENPIGRSSQVDGNHSTLTEGFHGAERGLSRGKTDIKQPRFSVTPGKLWTAFLYRWKAAFAVGLILAIVGASLAWLTYKSKYTATASMRMIASKPRLLPGAQGEDAGSLARGDFQKIQAQLVKSRTVVAAVLNNAGVKGLATVYKLETPQAQAWLEKELQADFIPGTDIFRIWLSGENPEDIRVIVNTVQAEYVDQFFKAAEKEQAHHYNTIFELMLTEEQRVRNKREDLHRLADLHKTGDTKLLTIRQSQKLDKYGKLESELSALEADMRRSIVVISELRVGMKNTESDKPSAELIEEHLASHPSVQKEQSEIARIEAQIKDYSKTNRSGSPRLQQYADELKAARAQLQKVKLDSQPDIMKRILNSMQQQRVINLQQAEAKHKIQFEHHKLVTEEARQLGQEVDKIGKGTFEIEALRNEIEEAESSLKKVRAEKERLEIEKFNKKKTIEGELPAEVPTVNQASLFKSAGVYSVVGLVFGLLLVSFLEARLHRVYHSTDVVQEIGIQTLGVLPLLEKGLAESYGRALPSEQSMSGIMFADAVNSLCTRLLCDDRLTRSAVIMVTSANEDEGKTLLATQLAAGLAHSGRRTLLLDCDFRKPRCHQQLGLSSFQGLSEVLSGDVELANAFQDIPNSDARFITAGETGAQVLKSLSNGEFAALLQRFRKDFDCIIIDSAPTMLVSDGLLLGKLADGVLMVVRSKVSTGPAVFSALEQLTALRIPVMGFVVNATPSRAWSRYYLR